MLDLRDIGSSFGFHEGVKVRLCFPLRRLQCAADRTRNNVRLLSFALGFALLLHIVTGSTCQAEQGQKAKA